MFLPYGHKTQIILMKPIDNLEGIVVKSADTLKVREGPAA